MKLEPLRIAGAFKIVLNEFVDERGLFARTFCKDELQRAGIEFDLYQSNTSFNVKSGTLRGMHFQKAPKAEKKIVRCTMGAVYDVVLDLRPDSPTYLQWDAVELTAENRLSLFIPEGVAHGFQTLADSSEMLYLVSAPYVPELYSGVRWNDPKFGIRWPGPAQKIISEKDATYPDYQ